MGSNIEWLIPSKQKELHEFVKADIRQEQIEKEKTHEISSEINARFNHDPFWNRRFWSIQHVHDCIDGKAFHWFWSPMKEVFAVSQIMFILVPVAAYFRGSFSIWTLVQYVLILKIVIIGARHFLEWYNNWLFFHVWEKAKLGQPHENS